MLVTHHCSEHEAIVKSKFPNHDAAENCSHQNDGSLKFVVSVLSRNAVN